ncbi:helix-turn-helix transcriptional regulator [Brevibacillus laterosporus]|uniref:helix-turn-helix transcriptional regulator n=1 Tax=Brevibacillus laterosporus TaxID=1465 RepID=UPI000C77F2AE|nr:helix-turn-helix transcriptional regulator [Brevibacillus laterosporus]AUM66354.1 XRE family transcriptional regulator [Brevibacillus laterosporus]AYB40009.1 XRE family transcriptional regulator [Brevibacillus laterosporus]
MKIKVKVHDFAQARIKKGFSQRGLAREINKAVSYISLLESGNRNPSPQVAKEICETLEVQFEVIFFIDCGHKSEQKTA